MLKRIFITLNCIGLLFIGNLFGQSPSCPDYINAFQSSSIAVTSPQNFQELSYNNATLKAQVNDRIFGISNITSISNYKVYIFISKETIHPLYGYPCPDWSNVNAPNIYTQSLSPVVTSATVGTILVNTNISTLLLTPPSIPETYYVKVGLEGVTSAGVSTGIVWSSPVKFILNPPDLTIPAAAYLNNPNSHTNLINWVYGVSYLDNGLTSEGIAYIDGLGKSRQVQSKINSENKIMAVEAAYSEEGGGTVMTLPAPIQNANASLFGYDYKFFDVIDPKTGVQRDFDTKDFDGEVKSNSTPNALMSPVAVSSGSSVGMYYSSQNTDAYVDDAGGFPYVYNVGYSNPLQRAMLTSGGAGDALKITSGKEYKHFYGNPDSQAELDRVYGNASNKKADKIARSITFNPEGVGHVSYTDNEGKLIATAIIGCTTPNLNSVTEDGMTGFTQHVNPLQNEVMDPVSLTKTASHKFFISCNNQKVSIDYNATIGSFTSPTGLTTGNTTICMNCEYDVDVIITNERTGEVVLNQTTSIVPSANLCPNNTQLISIIKKDIFLNGPDYFLVNRVIRPHVNPTTGNNTVTTAINNFVNQVTTNQSQYYNQFLSQYYSKTSYFLLRNEYVTKNNSQPNQNPVNIVMSSNFAGSGASNFGTSNALPLIGGTRFKGPSGLSFDNSGNLFVADHGNSSIRKYNASGGFFTNVAINLGSPFDVTWFNSNPTRGGAYFTYLLFSDKQSNTIKRVNVDGSSLSIAVSANISSPEGMSENNNGTVFFTSAGNGKVFRYIDPTDTDPIVEEVATSVQFKLPSDVEIDKNSSNIIYVSDRGNDQIFKIDISTTAGTLLETYGLANGAASVDDVNGSNAKFNRPVSLLYLNNFGPYTSPVLLVTEQIGNKIRLINLSGTHAVTTISGLATSGDVVGNPSVAQYNIPIGLCEDKGTVYLADGANNRIKKINIEQINSNPCANQPCFVNQWYPDEAKLVLNGGLNKIVGLDGDPDGISTGPKTIGDEEYVVGNAGTSQVINNTSPIYTNFVNAWINHNQVAPTILAMEVYNNFATTSPVKDLAQSHDLLNTTQPYYLLKVTLSTSDCKKQCDDLPNTTADCNGQCQEQLQKLQTGVKAEYDDLAASSQTYAYSATDNSQYTLQQLVNPSYPSTAGSMQLLNTWQKNNLQANDLILYQQFEGALYALQQFNLSKCVDICNGVPLPPCDFCVSPYASCVSDNLNEINEGVDYIKQHWNQSTLTTFPFTLNDFYTTTSSGSQIPDQSMQDNLGKTLFDFVVDKLTNNPTLISSYCFWDNNCNGTTGPVGGNCSSCFSPTALNGPNTYACNTTSQAIDLSNTPSFIIPLLETANASCIKEFNSCMASHSGSAASAQYLCQEAKDNCILGFGPAPAPDPATGNAQLIEWNKNIADCMQSYTDCITNPTSNINQLQLNMVTSSITNNLFPNALPADMATCQVEINYLLNTAPPLGVKGLGLDATQAFLDKYIEKKLCIKSCEDLIKNQFQQWLTQLIDKTNDEIKNAYFNQCLKAGKESFDISYSSSLYHYTLYNYDFSNNLTSTVPPEGIDYIDLVATPTRQPVHRMLSNYKSNSLYTLEAGSPDEGKTLYYYDKAGRVRFSQNAEQLSRSTPMIRVYSYIKYDNESRVIETGEYRGPAAPIQNMPSTTHPVNPFATFDETYISYDRPSLPFNAPVAGYAQTYVAGRVAKTMNADGAITHYSYDSHGRVKFVVQEFAKYGTGNKRFKTIDYNYLNLSSRVESITYQKWNAKEQFIHYYQYDADYRLVKTKVSRNGVVMLDAATYEYYLHGPMKRQGLGKDAQDMDFVYNINGWLKAINNPVNVNNSPNAKNEGLNSNDYAPDVFAEAINYFTGDYKRGGVDLDQNSLSVPKQGSEWFKNKKDLYTGNITSTLTYTAFDLTNATRPGATQGSTQSIQPVLAQAYQYDILGRLTDVYTEELSKGFTASRTSSQTPGVDDIYSTKISYDANGNINSLKRNSYYRYLQSIGAASTQMDNMTYYYDRSLSNGTAYQNRKAHNKLQYVSDLAEDTPGGEDIKKDLAANYTPSNLSSHKYTYDARGRIIHDLENKITFTYTAYNKVKTIIFDGLNKGIEFIYNAQQQRISKRKFGFGRVPVDEYYVYDANGILMATYKYSPSDVTGMPPNNQLEEWHVYGAGRLGTYRVNQDLNPTGVIAPISAVNQFFEITDHLGSVRAVVRGQKLANGNADIVNLTDYHEFGMSMQGRTFMGNNYKFGYQGSEKEFGVSGMYTTDFRGLDVRLGRWFIPDPITHPSQSPYCSMDNDPIGLTDVMGLEADGGGGDGGGSSFTPGEVTTNSSPQAGDPLFNTRGDIVGYVPAEGSGTISGDYSGNFIASFNFDFSQSAVNNTSIASPITEMSYGTLKDNYNKDGQSIISKEGSALNYLPKGTNTCAIRMSECLNKSGNKIPSSKDTPSNVRVQNGNDKDNGNFVLDAASMGNYLRDIEKPTYTFNKLTTNEDIDKAIDELKKVNDIKAIIVLTAGDRKAYGASGHVDLLYEDFMGDPSIYSYNGDDLETYLKAHTNIKFKLEVWILQD